MIVVRDPDRAKNQSDCRILYRARLQIMLSEIERTLTNKLTLQIFRFISFKREIFYGDRNWNDFNGKNGGEHVWNKAYGGDYLL